MSAGEVDTLWTEKGLGVLQPGHNNGFLVTLCPSARRTDRLVQELCVFLEKYSRTTTTNTDSPLPSEDENNEVQDDYPSTPPKQRTRQTQIFESKAVRPIILHDDDDNLVEKSSLASTYSGGDTMEFSRYNFLYNDAESRYYDQSSLLTPYENSTSLSELSLPSCTLKSVGSTQSLATTTSLTTTTSAASRKNKYAEMARLRGKTFMMPKPQLKFVPRIVNDDKPFIPKLTSKPNSKGPWKLIELKDPETGNIRYEHPYLAEIQAWSPTTHMLTITSPMPLLDLDDTPFTYVKTHDELQKMIQDLSQVQEFGFDVENSDRSYLGLTCLIQISTRQKDYIVDCFPLRNNLQTLNVVFTRPKILKIAHSAKSDVRNLQRDFGIYVVGLFDTSEAVKVINGNSRNVGLGALLLQYLDVEVDKAYQLADWRIRPLTKKMSTYARADSHFLIRLYDVMKEKLLESGSVDPLLQAYENSKGISLFYYEKPVERLRIPRKKYYGLNNQQEYALTELVELRGVVARLEDEGVEYVTSTKLLVKLAKELPVDEQKFLAIVKSAGGWRVRNLIERNVKKILKIMQEARLMTLVKKKTKSKLSVGGQPAASVHASTTEVDNFLFFSTKSPQVNPVDIVNQITEHLIVDPSFSFPSSVQSILPVSITCENELSVISPNLRSLLTKHDFSIENCKYGIFSNFEPLQQTELSSCVKRVVDETTPSWNFAQYSTDFCFTIIKVGNLCCLSLITTCI